MKIGMVAANLTGGEAEELRKAMGGKRSEAILAGMKTRLHRRHDGKRNCAGAAGGDYAGTLDRERVHVPRIARAQLCLHRVFECLYEVSLPRGVYLRAAQQSADGLLLARNDTQRCKASWPESSAHRRTALGMVLHAGRAEAKQTAARYTGPFAVRIGLQVCEGIAAERSEMPSQKLEQMDGPFASEYDLQRRVPSIRKAELTLLAKAGAFNWTGEKHHRRTALWRAERAGQSAGPLFENVPDEHELETCRSAAAA